MRLARTIKELRLRIHTLETGQKEEMAQLRYAQQQKEEILSAQLEKVLMQFKTLKSQNAALREQNGSLKAQVESLNRSLEEHAGRNAEQGSEVERLAEQYKLSLEQRLEEERARLADEIHSREMDVLNRDDLVNQLRAEISELKRDQMKVAHSGGQKILDKLESLGLSFIAFHPGAGHVSVAADQIADYMDNPVAFAARKCLVTEDHTGPGWRTTKTRCARWRWARTRPAAASGRSAWTCPISSSRGCRTATPTAARTAGRIRPSITCSASAERWRGRARPRVGKFFAGNWPNKPRTLRDTRMNQGELEWLVNPSTRVCCRPSCR